MISLYLSGTSIRVRHVKRVVKSDGTIFGYEENSTRLFGSMKLDTAVKTQLKK